jgi:hypothetical protein
MPQWDIDLCIFLFRTRYSVLHWRTFKQIRNKWQLLSVHKFQWDLAAILYATMCSEVPLKLCLKQVREYQHIQSWWNLLMSCNTRLLLCSRIDLERNKIRKYLPPFSSESFCLLPYKEKGARQSKTLNEMEWRCDVWTGFIAYTMNWVGEKRRRKVRKFKST